MAQISSVRDDGLCEVGAGGLAQGKRFAPPHGPTQPGEDWRRDGIRDDLRPALRLEDVSRVYRRGGEVRALDGVCVTVPRGAFLAVMGRSGSGKSTLLHVAAGLDVPTGGSVWIGDTRVSAVGLVIALVPMSLVALGLIGTPWPQGSLWVVAATVLVVALAAYLATLVPTRHLLRTGARRVGG